LSGSGLGHGVADITWTALERLARSSAAQWGIHIRRRHRKCSDAVVAVVHSVAAAIRPLMA